MGAAHYAVFTMAAVMRVQQKWIQSFLYEFVQPCSQSQCRNPYGCGNSSRFAVAPWNCIFYHLYSI